MEKYTILHNVEDAEFTVLRKYLKDKTTQKALIDMLDKYKHLDIVNDSVKLTITIK